MGAIGIDVGGTSTRVGWVDEFGEVVRAHRFATPPQGPAARLVRLIRDGIEVVTEHGAASGPQAKAIGLALPGIMDSDHRTLIRSVHLSYVEGPSIGDELAQATHCEVISMTDANAATLGEYQAVDRTPTNFAHLRSGTGVACGVIIDGELIELERSAAAHLKVLVVDTSIGAAACPCGQRGCLEAIAGGNALDDLAHRAGFAAGLVELQSGWERGSPQAVDLVRRAASGIVRATDNLAQRYGVKVVVLGGGVLSALPALGELVGLGVRDDDDACDSGAVAATVQIEPARLGDDAGIIGAALLARAADSEPT